jgi:nitrogen fixation-related uncharacterized protein
MIYLIPVMLIIAALGFFWTVREGRSTGRPGKHERR